MTSRAQSSALLCMLGLAACVPPKTEPGSEGPGELTDGASSRTEPTEGPPTPTSGDDTTSTSGADTTSADTTSTGAGPTTGVTDSTGVFESSTGEPPDQDHPLDPECSFEAIEGFDWGAAKGAKSKLDLASLEQVACPMQQELACGDGPIPGLQTALVIRNDQLPVPREFAVADTRWLVWSNRELGCDDPFGAPLCAGEWRIAWAVQLPEWCTSLRHSFGSNFGLVPGELFLIEFGDDACQTHTGTIKADDLDGSNDVYVQFPGGTLPPEAPQPARFCSQCQIPGVDVPVAGDFTADICP